MKIQIKFLTKSQRQLICKKNSYIDNEDKKRYCKLECPLRIYISNGNGNAMNCNCKSIVNIEKSIKAYWNKKIEVSE